MILCNRGEYFHIKSPKKPRVWQNSRFLSIYKYIKYGISNRNFSEQSDHHQASFKN